MSKNYGNDSQIAEIVKYISDTMKLPLIGAGGGFAPIGMYGFSCDYVLTPPQGWLFADGSIYNIADYPEYAALLASQHGRANIYGGDGVTTFATKDLRGEFIRGWGQNSHENQGSGENVGEHQDGTRIPALGASGSGTMYIGVDDVHNHDAINNNTSYANIKGSTGSTSGVEAFTSRPTNTSVAFFVKATVAGDANAHQYSTDEQVVGTTEDGEVLYEKTIAVTGSITNTAKQITQIADIKNLRRCFGYLSESAYDYAIPDGSVRIYRNGTNIYITSLSTESFNNTNGGKLTIQYTKTQ